MGFVFLWIALSVVVAVWASKKGREWWIWLVFALLFTPLVAGLFLALAKNLAAEEAAKRKRDSLKKCPRCAEMVKQEATVCRFCGYEFGSIPHPQPQNAAPG